MGNTTFIVVCLLTAIYLGIVTAGEKSHNMWLTRIETPKLNKSWIELDSMEVKKLNKNSKALSAKINTLQDLDSDEFMCEIKIYQSAAGKYLKAPVDFPKQPCCEFFKKNKAIWSCVQQRSSFPEECPIKKGPHWIKGINPDLCNPADNFPSNLPEDYKVTVTLTKGYAMIFSVTGYGKLKKKPTTG